MQKAIVILTVVCCMAFTSTGLLAAPVVVKWGDAAPKSFSYWGAMQAFKAEVDKKLPGKVDLQLFGDGVLGDQKAVLEQTTMGAIQICTVPSLVTTNIVPEHQVLDLPFVFPSQRAFSDFLVSSEGKRLGALFEKHGLKLLTWSGMNGTDVQNSKREIRTPADMKGLKIRSLPNPLMLDTIQAMGGMGVAMGSAEVYSAVQQGVIDGVYTAPQFLNAMKIYEVAKFYTPLNAHFAAGVTVVNLKFWNTLPPDVQKVFMEASETWNKVQEAYYLDGSKETSNQQAVDSFKKRGVKVTEPDINAFKKATIPVVKKYREKIGADSVDRVLKFVGYKME
jgi:tripartite ATP-independent transporter DctP family solute receptor